MQKSLVLAVLCNDDIQIRRTDDPVVSSAFFTAIMVKAFDETLAVYLGGAVYFRINGEIVSAKVVLDEQQFALNFDSGAPMGCIEILRTRLESVTSLFKQVSLRTAA